MARNDRRNRVDRGPNYDVFRRGRGDVEVAAETGAKPGYTAPTTPGATPGRDDEREVGKTVTPDRPDFATKPDRPDFATKPDGRDYTAAPDRPGTVTPGGREAGGANWPDRPDRTDRPER